jgi:hypothetical protein
MNAPSRQPAEQRQIIGEDFQHAIDSVAPPDQRRADRDQHADENHRPADRLALASRTRLGLRGVVGGRRVF